MLNFYKILISTEIAQFRDNLETIIDIAEKFNLVKTNFDEEDFTAEKNNSCLIYKGKNEEKTSYNCFFGNLHIRMEIGDNEKVYSIHLKKQNESWSFKGGDLSHPLNETYRIYVWYNVPVLNITRSEGELYKHGTWDKYLYKTLRQMYKTIDNCTDNAQFNKDYNK